MKNIAPVLIVLLFALAAQAQTVPAVTGSKVSQEQAQLSLDFHNKVRADVGSPALQWSEDLAKFAQAWADNLAKNDCAFEHRPRSGEWTQKYGENIFWGSASSYTALNATEGWYSEIKDYTYGPVQGNNFAVTGHYTQMVWKNSTHVGIGVATCSTGAILIVANYNPPGNYMGQKPY